MTDKQWKMRRQFGSNPDICAVLIWAVQQGLKGFRTRHPDMKRQRSVRMRDITIHASREIKRAGQP